MNAVILAAGRGTRLGEMPIPKGFLKINGETLIERSVALLKQHGVETVLVVTGHLSHHYEALAGITCVHNPRYASTGSLQSLQAAAPRIEGDFLLLESDLIYEPRALKELAKPDTLLLSGPTGSSDEVWVEAPGHELKNMSKKRELLQEVHGELVGISWLSSALLRRLERLQDSMEYEAGLVACAQEHVIHTHRVDGLRWAEIDDANHLERATRLFSEGSERMEENPRRIC